MTRFSSEPCAICEADTQHYVGKCVHCGSIAPRSQYQVKKASYRKRQFAYLAKRYGNRFDPEIAKNTVARWSGVAENAELRPKPDKAPDRAPYHRQSSFGRGRERTKA